MTIGSALPSGIHLMAKAAQEFIDANVSEQDIGWIMMTALSVEALRRTNGNQCKAARMLGIHRNTFSRHMKKVALHPFVGDVKKYVDTQLKLFGRKKLVASVNRQGVAA